MFKFLRKGLKGKEKSYREGFAQRKRNAVAIDLPKRVRKGIQRDKRKFVVSLPFGDRVLAPTIGYGCDNRLRIALSARVEGKRKELP